MRITGHDSMPKTEGRPTPSEDNPQPGSSASQQNVNQAINEMPLPSLGKDLPNLQPKKNPVMDAFRPPALVDNGTLLDDGVKLASEVAGHFGAMVPPAIDPITTAIGAAGTAASGWRGVKANSQAKNLGELQRQIPDGSQYDGVRAAAQYARVQMEKRGSRRTKAAAGGAPRFLAA